MNWMQLMKIIAIGKDEVDFNLIAVSIDDARTSSKVSST